MRIYTKFKNGCILSWSPRYRFPLPRYPRLMIQRVINSSFVSVVSACVKYSVVTLMSCFFLFQQVRIIALLLSSFRSKRGKKKSKYSLLDFLLIVSLFWISCFVFDSSGDIFYLFDFQFYRGTNIPVDVQHLR